MQKADIVDQSRMSDPVYRAAAEAALRAHLEVPKLDMPPGKYDLWKNTTFRFNPSGFFGWSQSRRRDEPQGAAEE